MRLFLLMTIVFDLWLLSGLTRASTEPSELVVNQCDKHQRCLKWVVISDTHSLENKKDVRNVLRNLPKGDILLHAGDFTDTGKVSEIRNFIEFLADAKREKGYSRVVFIAGNHDTTVDINFYQGLESWDKHNFGHWDEQNPELVQKMLSDLPEGIHYLQDQAMTINGYTVYGSPWSPAFGHWAFNGSEDVLSEKWAQIPDQTDILMTHGPAYGHGDLVSIIVKSGYGSRKILKHVGCPLLRDRISEIRPFIHLSGHIHEGYGVSRGIEEKTYFVNASTATHRYDPHNPAVVFYTPLRKSEVTEIDQEEKHPDEPEA